MAFEHAGEDEPPDRAARRTSPDSICRSATDSSPEYRALVPPPTWVTSGMPSSSHTDHSGSQMRRLYSGSSPSRIAGKFTPRSPASCAHSTSATAALDVPHRQVRQTDVAVGCLRRRSRRASGCRSTGRRRPAPDRRSASGLPSADRDERDRLQVHRCRGRSRRRRCRRGRSRRAERPSRGARAVRKFGWSRYPLPSSIVTAASRRSPSRRRTGRTRRGDSTGSSRGDPRRAAGRCACRWRRRRPARRPRGVTGGRSACAASRARSRSVRARCRRGRRPTRGSGSATRRARPAPRGGRAWRRGSSGRPSRR